ncbi:MAG: ribonuclease P [Nitrososphaerota archaeon]|nr:ribonuclease P [Nitrososphaerota archaeon]
MKQSSIKQIARQRIEILFGQAKKTAGSNPQLAAVYVEFARRIAMAARIRLPLEFRRETCRECNALFIHGVNCRVRVKQKREPHVVVTCLNCGNQTRYMLRKRCGV